MFQVPWARPNHMQLTRGGLPNLVMRIYWISAELLVDYYLLRSTSWSNDCKAAALTYSGNFLHELIKDPGWSARHPLVLFIQWLKAVWFQLFFANRIRVLSGKWPILLLGVAMIISCLVGSLVLMAKLWTSQSALTSLRSGLQWGMIVFTSLGPLADILIASYMCFYLWKFRNREPQFRRCASAYQWMIFVLQWRMCYRTRRILDTLARWTVGKSTPDLVFESCQVSSACQKQRFWQGELDRLTVGPLANSHLSLMAIIQLVLVC